MKNCSFSKIPCHIFPNQWFDFFCQNGRCHCWIYDWDERAPIIIHPCYRTRHRNFTLEWPRCSDQCNLEMCHELYYYWCWFCDISGSVVVTVSWYLYLCFVHFYFLLSALSVVHFSVSVYSGNPVSLFIDERFDCPLSHLIMFRGFLLKSADTSFLWLLFHHYMNCIRFIL